LISWEEPNFYAFSEKGKEVGYERKGSSPAKRWTDDSLVSCGLPPGRLHLGKLAPTRLLELNDLRKKGGGVI